MHSSLSFLYLFIDCVETGTIPVEDEEYEDPSELLDDPIDESKQALDMTEGDQENEEFIDDMLSRRRKPLKPSKSRGIYAFVTLFLLFFFY